MLTGANLKKLLEKMQGPGTPVVVAGQTNTPDGRRAENSANAGSTEEYDEMLEKYIQGGSSAEIKSLASHAARMVRFLNTSPRAVELFWVDFDGAERKYAVIAPWKSLALSSFAGHLWLVRVPIDAATHDAGQPIAVRVVRAQLPGQPAKSS